MTVHRDGIMWAPRDLGWVGGAACAGMDPELWQAVEGSRAERRAMAVCAGCPVRRECLAAGMADPSSLGVWGGLNATQRRRLRRAGAR